LVSDRVASRKCTFAATSVVAMESTSSRQCENRRQTGSDQGREPIAPPDSHYRLSTITGRLPMRRLIVPGPRLAVLAVMLSVSTATLAAARLYPEAVNAWSAYVSVTEGRIQQELRSSSGFLGMDFGRDAASERRDVLGGAIVVRMMQSSDA